jgi:hypothetical protein
MYHIATKVPTHKPITIRAGGPGDREALSGLAQRDSRPVPEGELLIALVDGEARAAVSLVSGAIIADPFHRTEELVEMLTLRAAEPRGETRVRGLRWLLGSRSGRSAAQPACTAPPLGAQRTGA